MPAAFLDAVCVSGSRQKMGDEKYSCLYLYVCVWKSSLSGFVSFCPSDWLLTMRWPIDSPTLFAHPLVIRRTNACAPTQPCPYLFTLVYARFFVGHLLLEACRRCDLVLVKRLLNSTDDVHKTGSPIVFAPGIATIASSMEPPLPSIPGESGTPKKPAMSGSLASPSCGTPDLIHFRHPFSGDTTLHMAATVVVKVDRSKDDDRKTNSSSSVVLVSQRRQLIEFLISRCVQTPFVHAFGTPIEFGLLIHLHIPSRKLDIISI